MAILYCTDRKKKQNTQVICYTSSSFCGWHSVIVQAYKKGQLWKRLFAIVVGYVAPKVSNSTMWLNLIHQGPCLLQKRFFTNTWPHPQKVFFISSFPITKNPLPQFRDAPTIKNSNSGSLLLTCMKIFLFKINKCWPNHKVHRMRWQQTAASDMMLPEVHTRSYKSRHLCHKLCSPPGKATVSCNRNNCQLLFKSEKLYQKSPTA